MRLVSLAPQYRCIGFCVADLPFGRSHTPKAAHTLATGVCARSKCPKRRRRRRVPSPPRARCCRCRDGWRRPRRRRRQRRRGGCSRRVPLRRQPPSSATAASYPQLARSLAVVTRRLRNATCRRSRALFVPKMSPCLAANLFCSRILNVALSVFSSFSSMIAIGCQTCHTRHFHLFTSPLKRDPIF